MTADRPSMIRDLVAATRDALTVQRVFGEPYENNGVTVIPAAVVRGGVGGGGGADERDQHGEGGGFGVVARPAGAIVITDGAVTWQPAVDVDRVASLAAAVVAIGFLTVGRRRRVRG
jgi:uncharacterized spore protein YtfJ